MDELGEALAKFDADENIGCMVLPAATRPSPPAPTSAR